MDRRAFLSRVPSWIVPLSLPEGRAPSGVVVIVSADAEWRPVQSFYPRAEMRNSPYGELVLAPIGGESVPILHGGWGKIAAAGSAQFAIDTWNPTVLINLGTCGGIEGAIKRGQTVLASRTIVYDIVELMGDGQEAVASYTSTIDLSWLGDRLPIPVLRSTLVSADRDLAVEDIPRLQARYGAVAADWESGAIANIAIRNGRKVLILRSVSDLVGRSGGEAYGNVQLFQSRTNAVMRSLLQSLPAWLALCRERLPGRS